MAHNGKKSSGKSQKDWFTTKAPKSSMEGDHVLTFDFMKSPHEESWWNPGEPKDSKVHQHDAYHPIEADEESRYVMKGNRGSKSKSAAYGNDDSDSDAKYNSGDADDE